MWWANGQPFCSTKHQPDQTGTVLKVRHRLHQMAELPIPPPGRRSAGSSISTSASRASICSSVHKCSGLLAVGETTQPSPSLEAPPPLGEDHNI